MRRSPDALGLHARALAAPGPDRRGVALLGSVVLHGILATQLGTIEPPPPEPDTWVEMAIHERPPPPEPEPEPEPAKEPPKVVKHRDTSPAPAQKAAPKQPVRRLVHGLSNRSLSQKSASPVRVRTGTTVAVAATAERMSPEEADGRVRVAYGGTTKAPTLTRRPTLTVPDEVSRGEVEGTVQIVIDVSETGRVLRARVVKDLHPAADAACLRDVRTGIWTPGVRDGAPVIVTGVPFACRYEALD